MPSSGRKLIQHNKLYFRPETVTHVLNLCLESCDLYFLLSLSWPNAQPVRHSFKARPDAQRLFFYLNPYTSYPA